MHPTVVRRTGGLRAVRVVTALVALLLVAATTGPAQAERYIHREPAHDVRKVSMMTMDDNGFVRAPHRTQGDYVKVKIWHQVRAVRVVGKFRRLDRIGNGVMQVVSIRTPDGAERSFTVVAGRGFWKGVDDDQPGTNCVIGHHVNYARDRFSMRISRKCLSQPRWVRVGVGFISIGDRALFADDAQLRKVRDELTYSPRLKHA